MLGVFLCGLGAYGLYKGGEYIYNARCNAQRTQVKVDYMIMPEVIITEPEGNYSTSSHESVYISDEAEETG